MKTDWMKARQTKYSAYVTVYILVILAVLGAASDEGLVVRDASELRVKETDRISTIAENFKRMGLAITIREDGFEIPGRQSFHAAELDSFGDHRIAMAFSIAALAADRRHTQDLDLRSHFDEEIE